MKRIIEKFIAYLRYERNVSSNTIREYRRDTQQFAEFLTPPGAEDAHLDRDRSPHGERVRELDVRPTLGKDVDCAKAGVVEDILQILHARKAGAREPGAFRTQTEAAKACAAGSDSRRTEWIP